MVPLFDTIHIGTHGHDDTRPLLSAIEFGRDRLHAWEVMQLRLYAPSRGDSCRLPYGR